MARRAGAARHGSRRAVAVRAAAGGLRSPTDRGYRSCGSRACCVLMSDPAGGGRAWQYAGVGCVTAAAGFFGGGMIGVFVGWIVGHLTRGTPTEGFPICNFH